MKAFLEISLHMSELKVALEKQIVTCCLNGEACQSQSTECLKHFQLDGGSL